jgi:hypothetical protein
MMFVAPYSTSFPDESGWIPFMLGRNHIAGKQYPAPPFRRARVTRQDRRGTDFRYAAIAFSPAIKASVISGQRLPSINIFRLQYAAQRQLAASPAWSHERMFSSSIS